MARATLTATMAFGIACQTSSSTLSVDEFVLNVDFDLEAAVEFGEVYAVGATFVVSESGTSWDLGQSVHDISHVRGWGFDVIAVVGDEGFVALSQFNDSSDDGAPEFIQQPAPTIANIVGVAGYATDEITIVVVGEEVLAVGRKTPEDDVLEWSVPPIPVGGWGNLRDVRVDDSSVCALGDAGALFCSELPTLSLQRVELDSDADLTRFCEGDRLEAVGPQGAIVRRGPDSEWTSSQVADVDFVACSTTYFQKTIVVGSDRTLYKIAMGEVTPFWELDWQPMGFDFHSGRILVGENGHAARVKDSVGY